MAGYDSTKVWLDGPGIVAWIEDEIGSDWLAEMDNPNVERRVFDWRSGRPAGMDAVDRVLCRLGYTLALIPDELWIEKPPTKDSNRECSAAQKAAAVARVAAGESQTSVARDYDVVPRTVSHWCMRHGLTKPKPVAPPQKTCSVVGCGRYVRRRKMCQLHYRAWQRNNDGGTPGAASKIRTPGDPSRAARSRPVVPHRKRSRVRA
jgi:hypothetical protein